MAPTRKTIQKTKPSSIVSASVVNRIASGVGKKKRKPSKSSSKKLRLTYFGYEPNERSSDDDDISDDPDYDDDVSDDQMETSTNNDILSSSGRTKRRSTIRSSPSKPRKSSRCSTRSKPALKTSSSSKEASTSKNVKFDDDSGEESSATKKNHLSKSLQRPSLKRFRLSSTSSMSDVENSEAKKRKATKLEKVLKKKNESQKIPFVVTCGADIWGEHLPKELLVKIFAAAIYGDDGQIPLLLRVQRVCRSWRAAAKTPVLWTTLDLDAQKSNIKMIKDPKAALLYLSDFVPFTKSLSLSRWTKLKIGEFDNFMKKSTIITELDLSFCSAILSKSLFENSLPNFCPQLESLNLSYYSTVGQSMTVGLCKYLKQNGPNLRRLYLNGNTTPRFYAFCESSIKITNCMRNLQVLDISRLVDVQSKRFTFVSLVQAFPRLTHLYMSDSFVGLNLSQDVDFENFTEEVWPNLIEVEFAVHQTWFGFVKVFETLMKCLQRCKSLRRLRVSGHRICEYLNLLVDIPLTHLDISRTSDIRLSIGATMQKWSKCLLSLNISWLKSYETLPEICHFLIPFSDPPPPLRELIVAGTPITSETLKAVILACPKLDHLDCTSCRNLPLGMKRVYDGNGEIMSLVDKLNEHL